MTYENFAVFVERTGLTEALFFKDKDEMIDWVTKNHKGQQYTAVKYVPLNIQVKVSVKPREQEG